MTDIQYLSHCQHVNQILTGFHMLMPNDIRILDGRGEHSIPMPAAVAVCYRGMRLIYDLDDGYQNIEGIQYLLENSDFYFKRSFSPKLNQQHFPSHAHKMFPLGFNYYVTYPQNPLNPPVRPKQFLKSLLGIPSDSYFTPEVFEHPAKISGNTPTVLFYTRLWEKKDSLPRHYNLEREQLNEERIVLLRHLREALGSCFLGGVEDSSLARSLCPELVLPHRATRKERYLQTLHNSCICIGTTGLHNSIGWKTGEYVAAGKAIVSQPLHFSVPGDFDEGSNYLTFQTPEQCVSAIQSLQSDPKLLQTMQNANKAYYQQYLRPDALIQNTLNIVDSCK